jgi:hypothetical protein
MANNEKKETTPLTWIITLVVAGLVFVITKNAFEGKPYLLFESAESKRIRTTEECKQEAYERAKGLRESELAVLKAKKNPTPLDLAQIEDLENRLAEGLVSRDDKDYYFNKCMDRNGY